MLLATIRKSKITKVLSALLAMGILNSILPMQAFALTAGPTQPEVQSFEPIGTNQMVDLFSGDFTYNIPLFELPGPDGGYPFNLAYHSGIGMEQEASWVGLGWNLNPGAIVRNLRGLPDDFNKESITINESMKPNWTLGMDVGANIEIFGADLDKALTAADKGKGKGGVNASVKLFYNNYKGVGLGFGIGGSFGIGDKMTGGLGLDVDSENGANVSADLSLVGQSDKYNKSYGLGLSFGSKRGLDASLKGTIKSRNPQDYKKGKKQKLLNKVSGGAGISFSDNSFLSSIPYETVGGGGNLHFKLGVDAFGTFVDYSIGVSYDISELKNNGKDVEVPSYGYMHYEKAFDYDWQNDKGRKYQLDFTREKDGRITQYTTNLGIPHLTYDFYSVQGQGISGMFRPYRSEIGHVHEPFSHSQTHGGSGGAEFDAVLKHWGASIAYYTSHTKTGDWYNKSPRKQPAYNNGNHLHRYSFENKVDDPSYEPCYFKIRGEYTSFVANESEGDEYEQINLDAPLGIEIKDNGDQTTSNSFHYTHNNNTENIPLVRQSNNYSRLSRTTSILPLTNADIETGTQGGADLEEFAIDYYQSSKLDDAIPGSPSKRLSRFDANDDTKTESEKDKFGAFSVTNANGMKYVYGLPAMNKTQEEYLFSVNSTDGASKYVNMDNFLSGEAIQKASESYFHDADNKESPQYFKKTTTPQYAHSFLLTSVLGADYVDVDGNGPSADDLGYWVKFNYVKADDNFKWRAPYADANYSQGLQSFPDDDKGSVMYGEKEIWYLKTAETRSHIAVFELEQRNDGIGAKRNGNMDNGSLLHFIRSIKLYTKKDYEQAVADQDYTAIPVKTVTLKYAHDSDVSIEGLCPNTLNSKYSNGTKLTLAEVHISNFEDNSLNPYKFRYSEINAWEDGEDAFGNECVIYNSGYGTSTTNYAFNEFAVDRWGCYKPFDIDGNANNSTYEEIDKAMNFPYVEQCNNYWQLETPQELKNNFYKEKAAHAAAWAMTSIQLPSGGKIHIDYESDDYAYVQQREATQMFKIAGIKSVGSNLIYDNEDWDVKKNESWTGTKGTDEIDELGRLRVYFQLEEPISVHLSDEEIADKIRKDYIEGLKRKNGTEETYQLYFKNFTDIRDGYGEYINGYADIDLGENAGSNYEKSDFYGAEEIYADGDNNVFYRYGYLTIKKQKITKAVTQAKRYYHPFSSAAWFFIRTSKPQFLTRGKVKTKGNFKDMSKGEKKNFVKAHMGVFDGLKEFFTSFTTHAFSKGWASKIDLDKSVIRLCSPDKIKYGGGSRVKRVYISDEWTAMKTSARINHYYGQEYDYTKEEGGKIISSGVATYEPMIGGDENPLRWAKPYTDRVPFKTDNNLFFEYPINESCYPGPSVGYSKVTVKNISFNRSQELMKYLNSGVSVSEFYTCHDFPVITYETNLSRDMDFAPVIIPFVGMIENNSLTASQGYSIVLNDMHGKPKKTENWGQDDNGKITELINRVEYFYHETSKYFDGKNVRELVNRVKVLVDDAPLDGESQSQIETRTIGVEYDAFADYRIASSFYMNGGLSINFKRPWAIVIIPLPWPDVIDKSNITKLAVTNKVVHKSGILKRVVATDGQSVVETENELFDALTGQALLTRTKNNFDNDVYNYSFPAYREYENMGASYKSEGIEFTGNITFQSSSKFNLAINTIIFNNSSVIADGGDVETNLHIGDILIANYENAGVKEQALFRITEKNKDAQNALESLTLFMESNVSTAVDLNNIQFKKLTSTHKNMLTQKVGDIVALSDPTEKTKHTVNYPYSEVVDEYKLETNALINDLIKSNFIEDIQSRSDGNLVSFSDPFMFDKNGDHKYPLLHMFHKYVTLSDCGCGMKGYFMSDGEPDDNAPYLNVNNNSDHFGAVHIEFDTQWKAHSTRLATDHLIQNIQDRYVAWKNVNFELRFKSYELFQEGTDEGRTKTIYDIYIDNNEFYDDFVVTNATGCGHNHPSSIPVDVFKIKNVLSMSASSLTDEPNFPGSGNKDYILGAKGIWRPFKSYFYNDYRLKGVDEAELETDGVLVGEGTNHEVIQFDWQIEKTNLGILSSDNWKLVNEITRMDEYGNALENVDVLGNYSCAHYGYNNMLPVAVASNAEYDEVLYVSFDEDSYIAKEESNQTYGYESSSTRMYAHDLSSVGPDITGHNNSSWKIGSGWEPTENYSLKNSGIILKQGTYVFSAWVSASAYGSAYSGLDIGILVDPSKAYPQNITHFTSNDFTISENINGWQKIEFEFTMQESWVVWITLSNSNYNASLDNNIRIDDIRIHPVDATMKTFAYDGKTLRLTAEMDENNYSTFYYYDTQGQLYLTKKESEKGIITLQESRSHQAKY